LQIYPKNNLFFLFLAQWRSRTILINGIGCFLM